ncbi:hypothetical protein F0M18_00095 [Pseudohalioglobus sediminis]|uniref:SPOR domain-containing protein n=1 Tax=Pseudohalioglobus sediminis TaxID=2606449 RepID=A0A5B0X3M6_9GAMM|nr:SPOR domain-containing protein [Pseudohalioglobus sediminis]KAA1193886.1 hypothetical protein F0M18_00095 [Pseudohalioglobus sediminis]
MNEVLKQRLVGALILVALGVVFWPIIFVEPGAQGGAEAARVPPRPAVDTSPIEPPDIAGLRPSREFKKEVEPAGVDDEILTLSPDGPLPTGSAASAAGGDGNQPATAPPPSKPEPKSQPEPEPEAAPRPEPRSEPPVKPALDAEGIPITWILRVASVSSAEKADALRKDLLGMGHKAYVKKVNSGGRTLYRVYIGPKVEKAKLEQVRGAIDSRFGVKSMITRYYP